MFRLVICHDLSYVFCVFVDYWYLSTSTFLSCVIVLETRSHGGDDALVAELRQLGQRVASRRSQEIRIINHFGNLFTIFSFNCLFNMFSLIFRILRQIQHFP